MKYPRSILLLLLGFIVGGYFGWALRSEGKVLASSQNQNILGQPRILIRQVSESPGFFGWRFESLEDNFRYRFEYYAYSSPAIYSCQTFVGKSYRANCAEIRWEPSGDAVVVLDTIPKFRCDTQGQWQTIAK